MKKAIDIVVVNPIMYIVSLVPGLPKGSPETAKVRTLTTLQGYNFFVRPPIGTRSKAKL